jgi:tetracycline resistance efflux pump
MDASWMVLLPPLIVILIAAYTKRILFALFVGIMASALIITNGNSIDAFYYAMSKFWRVTEIDRLSSVDGFWSCSYLFVLFFTLMLGILIVTIRRSGAAHVYGAFATKKIKTIKGAESASLIMTGLFAAIDDYFTSMTLGSVMRPITDQFSIPRVKLAILISVVAAPMSMILPFSSWGADLMILLRSVGVSEGHSGWMINADPLVLYLSSIPFMLYAIVMIFVVWYMTSSRISYGVIARHELYAAKTGELFGGKLALMPPQGADATEAAKKNSKFIDFLFPFVTLYTSIIVLILWSGGWTKLGGTLNFFSALREGHFYFSFAVGGCASVVLSLMYYLARKQLSVKQLPGVIGDGFFLINSTLVALAFSWVFSRMIVSDLRTGSFLAELIVGQVSVAFFPLMFFVFAAIIAALLGRTGGTITILVPLAFEMVPSFLGLSLPIDPIQVPILGALLGAIVSGSVVGKQLSPVADTTLMTSTMVGCYHLDLVKSQVQLALPSFFASLCGYYVIGVLLDTYGAMTSAIIALIVALVINLVIVHVLYWLSKYRTDKFYHTKHYRR